MGQYFDIFVDLGSCECDPLERYKSCQDIFSNEFLVDPILKGIQLAKLKSLYYRLIARGAIVSDHLHGEVTHIVIFDDIENVQDRRRMIDVSRVQDFISLIRVLCSFGLCVKQDRIRLLRRLDVRSFEKRIVTEKWVEECISTGQIVDVSN